MYHRIVEISYCGKSKLVLWYGGGVQQESVGARCRTKPLIIDSFSMRSWWAFDLPGIPELQEFFSNLMAA